MPQYVNFVLKRKGIFLFIKVKLVGSLLIRHLIIQMKKTVVLQIRLHKSEL